MVEQTQISNLWTQVVALFVFLIATMFFVWGAWFILQNHGNRLDAIDAKIERCQGHG